MLRAFLALALLLAFAAPAHATPVGWAPTGSLSTPRSGFKAVTLDDGRVLVVGGGGPGASSSAELFDPATGRWSPAAPMADSRIEQFDLVKLRDGTVLVGGGYGVPSGASSSTFLASVERYHPKTNTWTRAGSFPKARVGVTMVALSNGAAMAFGGWWTAGGWTGGVDLFLPGSNTWYLATSASNDGGTGGHVQLSDGRVLFPNARRLYDPQSNIWSTTTPPLGDLSSMGVAPIATGALAAGGLSSYTGWASSAQRFDRLSNTWVPVAPMSFARPAWPVPLADGRVLNLGQSGIASELYDPVADTWTPTASVPDGLSGTAVALRDGRVLLVGGGRYVDGIGLVAVGSALYTPDTTLTADPLTFAPQTPGVAASGTVRITNTGGVLAQISGLRLSGHPEFRLADQRCGEALAPGAACTVTIGFTPSAVSDYTAELSFSANTVAGVHRVAIRGRGAAAEQPLPAPGTDGSPTDRCPGLAGPAARLGCPAGLLADPSIAYRRVQGGIKVVAYYVKATTGARVTVKCSKGCRPTTFTGKGAKRVRVARLNGKRLKNGTTITITVTKPGRLTTTVTDRITKSRRVEGRPRCAPVGC